MSTITITITIILHNITNIRMITRYGGEGAEAMMGFFTELLNIAKQQNLNQVRHLSIKELLMELKMASLSCNGGPLEASLVRIFLRPLAPKLYQGIICTRVKRLKAT